MRFDTFFDLNTNISGFLPHLVIAETKHGKGIKSRNSLKPFTALCTISGPVIKYEETIKLGSDESYCLQLGLDKYIRPGYPFYLFNHSCNPNCGISQDYQLITITEISAGEELCWDYSTSMLERRWRLECSCGQHGCRKIISDFDLLPHQLQQKYLDLKIVMPFIREYLWSNNH